MQAAEKTKSPQTFPTYVTAKKIISLIFRHRDISLDIENFREYTDDFKIIMRFLSAVKQYVNQDPLGIYPNITSIIYQNRNYDSAVSSSDSRKVYFSARALECQMVSMSEPVYYCNAKELYLCNNSDMIDARNFRWQVSNGYGIFRHPNMFTGFQSDAARETFLVDCFFPIVLKMYQDERINASGCYVPNSEPVSIS